MLPHHQPVFLQIVYVIEWRLGQELEQEPADVGVKESFADVVGIFLVIDVLVMAAMFARPHQDGVFERTRAEEQDDKTDWPFGLERDVGEQAVITERDAEGGHRQKHKEEGEMKPIEPEIPEVKRYCGDREEERADQERTGDPVDPAKRDTGKHRSLTSQDDVLFHPGVDAIAMRTGEAAALLGGGCPEGFVDRFADGRQLCGGRAAD